MPLNITTLVVDEIDDNDEVDFTPTYEEELVDEQESTDSANGVELKITQIDEEETLEQTSARLVQEQGEYNQRLDLPNFQFPPISMLKKYDTGNTLIDQKELEVNKNSIKLNINEDKVILYVMIW